MNDNVREMKTPSPTQKLLETILQSLKDRQLKDFYDYESWEGPLRNHFQEMVTAFRSSRASASEPDWKLVRELSGRYHTRYAIGDLPTLVDVTFEHIHAKGWWQETPPLLFECSPDDLGRLRTFPAEILRELAMRRCKKGYSLVTKCLHFCFPWTFAIYDEQAARSIRAWNSALWNANMGGRPFSLSSMKDTSGRGYGAIAESYRHLWAAASHEQRAGLTAGAQRLSASVGGLVSVLDVFDKVLWRAAGNPARLGL